MRRILQIAASLLAVGILFTACEYDPSLYEDIASDKDLTVGPNFRFTDYNYTQMNFDDNTPDSVYANDEFRFTAQIESYNELTGLLELQPISTVYRGS